jgi:hypothetical protein
MSRTPAAGAAVVLVLLVAAGCSTAGNGAASGSLPPTASPIAPSAAAATTRTEPSASATATPFPSFPTVTITDPALIMNVPPGWAELPVENYRLMIESMASAQPSGLVVAAGLDMHLADIDAGLVRLVLVGPSGAPPWTATMIVQVDPPVDSLDAAVRRADRRIAALGGVQPAERRPVRLAAGTGIRRSWVPPLPSAAPSGAVPAQSIEYVVLLEDGRAVWILASAPASSITFPGVVDGAVMTLRPR